MALNWCNLSKEKHEESACEVKRNVRDKIFGKRLDTKINTRKNSYTAKGKYDLLRTSSTPRSW
jgi:hypothetical protein